MSDHVHSHDATEAAPLTPDAFIADRQRFWDAFTRFVTFSTISVVVLLVVLAVFLV